MCIAFIVLLLENIKLFYISLLFCLCVEILAVTSLFKCLIANKCLENRVETLQTFKITKEIFYFFTQMLFDVFDVFYRLYLFLSIVAPYVVKM